MDRSMPASAQPANPETTAPDTSDSQGLLDRALASHGEGRAQEAAGLYETFLALQPDHALALHNLGVLRADEGRNAEAAELIGRAAAADPTSAATHANLGSLLLGLGRSEEARASFERALEIEPANHGALTGLGDVLAAGRDLDAAEASYLRAIDVDPNYTPALTGLGIALMRKGQPREAGERFCQVLALQPRSARAHYNVANALKALGRLQEAASMFLDALRLAPNFADAWTNLGNLMQTMNDPEEALVCHRRASELTPHDPRVRLNLGQVLKDRGDAYAAKAELEAALRLDPQNVAAELSLCMAELEMTYPDEAAIQDSRTAYASRLDALIARYDQSPDPERYASAIGMSQPFYLPYQGMDDLELQSRYGRFVCRVMQGRRPAAAFASQPAANERIRVGVVSGFFRAHSNWKAPIRGWIEHLDRSRFEVIGYFTGVVEDEITQEARALCDRFHQGVPGIEAWREQILADAPHVLIYPEIGMDPVSVQLAAQRLAPLQCASWGHPHTSGMPTIDAFISSDLMEPAGADAHYSERLVRLPGLGIRVEPVQEEPDPIDRATLGLRESATVFWCAQSLPKYLPRFDDIYPRIAQQVGDCQFVFIGLAQRSQAESQFFARLKAAFARAGLDFERHCALLPRLGRRQFLGALSCADVLLDSLEWSGCNSTLESLGADLPMVAFDGKFMRGRHTAAMLEIMELGEFVAGSVDDYVQTAVRLGLDPAARGAARAAIAERKLRLYRDDRCVRALEDFIETAVRHGDLFTDRDAQH
jgi:protein O-GlcNAc transferase